MDLVLLYDEKYEEILFSSGEYGIEKWNLKTKECIKNIEVDSVPIKINCDKIQIFNTKTIVFVSCNNEEIIFYDIDTLNFICNIRSDVEDSEEEEEEEGIFSCPILKDGTLVTVGSDKLIRFWS